MEYDEDDKPVRTLDNDDEIPSEAKRRISEREIQDRSKGDILSKGFALLQASWFIIEIISRKIDGLPVTQLEIATLAFAALNLVTYILWWNKPLNVSHPVRVYPAQNYAVGHVPRRNVELKYRRRREAWVRRLSRGCIGPLAGFSRGLVDFLKEVYRPIAAGVKTRGWSLTFMFPDLLFGPILSGTSSASNERRVGTFSPKIDGLGYSQLMSVVVGIMFGGIHCIAWAFHFPSRTEHILWRISAVSVAGVPLLVTFTVKSFIVYVGSDSGVLKFLAGALKLLAKVLVVFIIPSVLLYVSARLTLLVLPFMSLRSLPPDAYRTAGWTSFIPHI